MRTPVDVLEVFAGPGGWSTGMRRAGYTGRVLGIECNADACATATAAEHERLRGDAAAIEPDLFRGVIGAILSPPCPPWSTAGNQGGQADQAAVFARMTAFAHGCEPAPHGWVDERSALTAEPMRYVHALRPRWVALEQVPPVLPLWQHAAALLRDLGYSTWCGVLSAERYGVPQTRKRAILIARRDGHPAQPPAPTHQAFGEAAESTLFGEELPPPVSMADALGWGLPDRPAWTITAGGTATGGAEVFGNYANRQQLARLADAEQPAADWVLRSNYSIGGDLATRTIRLAGEPATTITSHPGHWTTRTPAELIEHDGKGRRRVSVAEAGVLQGFPADYPWQGTKSARYQQIGDAVPPPLAAAILAPLIHHIAPRSIEEAA